MERVPMTQEGYDVLEAELKRLKMTERPAIIQAIAEARAHGDLSENAEYHAAKERQGFIEGRVMELEAVISRAEIIDPSEFTGNSIKFGATIKLADEDTDEEVTYRIVGTHESDISKGKISVTSPLGRALIGKEPGDSIEVVTPKGQKAYEVCEVSYK